MYLIEIITKILVIGNTYNIFTMFFPFFKINFYFSHKIILVFPLKYQKGPFVSFQCSSSRAFGSIIATLFSKFLSIVFLRRVKISFIVGTEPLTIYSRICIEEIARRHTFHRFCYKSLQGVSASAIFFRNKIANAVRHR